MKGEKSFQGRWTDYGTAQQRVLFIRSSQAVFFVTKEKKENVEFCLDQRTRRKGTVNRMDRNLSKRVEERNRRELRVGWIQGSASGASSDLD